MKRISVTALKTWNLCRFRWFGNYLLNLQQESEPLVFGKLLDLYVSNRLGNGEREGNYKVYTSLFVEELSRLNENNIEQRKEVFLSCLELCDEVLIPKIEDKVLEVQKEFEFDIIDDFAFVGIIDLVLRGNILADIKTAGREWYAGQEEAELQPKAYSYYLFQKNKRLKKVKFLFYIIIKGKVPRLDIREVTVTREESESFFDYMRYELENMRYTLERYVSTENPRVFGFNNNHFLCSKRYCPVWQECQKAFGIKIKD